LQEREVEGFEQEYSINLPSCYKAFLIHVGNGMCSSGKSGLDFKG